MKRKTCLILNGLIANFQPDEMLEGLEERLVEVEVDELGGVLQEGGDDPVKVPHRTFGDVEQGVTGSLKVKRTELFFKSELAIFEKKSKQKHFLSLASINPRPVGGTGSVKGMKKRTEGDQACLWRLKNGLRGG